MIYLKIKILKTYLIKTFGMIIVLIANVKNLLEVLIAIYAINAYF